MHQSMTKATKQHHVNGGHFIPGSSQLNVFEGPTYDEQVTIVNVDGIHASATGQQQPCDPWLIYEVAVTALMVNVHWKRGVTRPCHVMKSSNPFSEIW
jgi:hypothetical protein